MVNLTRSNLSLETSFPSEARGTPARTVLRLAVGGIARRRRVPPPTNPTNGVLGSERGGRGTDNYSAIVVWFSTYVLTWSTVTPPQLATK